MTWVCAVCTYSENVDARTICELCGSERPGRLSSGSKQSFNQEVQGSDIDEAILVSMGFPIESVKNALALHSNREDALEWLSSSTTEEQKSTAEISHQSSLGDDLNHLMNLGISEKHAQKALSSTTSLESAVDWALSNPDPYSQPSNLKEESKIASNSGSTSIRGSSGDTILKCNKLTHIGKEISIEEERIRLEAAKSEEHERLIEQEKRKLKQPEMTTKIKTLEQIKAEKLALEKKKQSERVERMLKLKEREQKDILDAEKRRLDRLSKESHLRDIPSALKLLKNSHGQSKFREVLKFITKILENVIRYPENPKYRSISTESTAFKTIISEHIGATSILRILGFQDVPKSHKLQLINLNLDFLSEELKKMQSVLDYNRTNISKIFAEEISSSVDDKLLSVIALEELFENVLINISSLFTRTIPKDGDLFTGILGRVPASISVLEFAGFIDKQFSYVLEEVDGSFLSSILEDLRTFRKNHVDETNIYKQLLNAKEKNEPEKVCKAVQLLIVAIENVVKDPHSTKYHKCLLKKILGTTFSGGIPLLSALGMKVEKEDSLAYAVFPHPFTRGILYYQKILRIFKDCKMLLKIPSYVPKDKTEFAF